MSREHYCLGLTSATEKSNGQEIVIFIDHIASLLPEKDGTCQMKAA
jgi:hypothetical protein